MKWIANRCRRRRDISLLAAGALGGAEKAGLESHLAACQECRDYYAALTTLTAPLADWEESLSAIEATPAARMRWAGAVREAAVSSAVRPSRLANVWQSFWRELIWPSRYAWTGMAALWVLMLAVNGRISDRPIIEAGAHSSSPREMMQAWEEQNRILAELAQPSFVAPAAPPNVPRPRSQRERDWAII
jgi:predicted anti-sigma-YlaC factor YlaD